MKIIRIIKRYELLRIFSCISLKSVRDVMTLMTIFITQQQEIHISTSLILEAVINP